jgi:small nuclear ribonucleoprotein (snRNP)-like protein
MSLKEYYDKKVMIKYINGELFKGKVEDYNFPEDNDSGNESIIIRVENGKLNGKLVEFEENDIKEIQVI